MDNKALNYILTRHLKTEEQTFTNIFACDDKKKEKKNYNQFYNLSKVGINKVVSEAHFYNTGSFGVFFSLNPLSSDKRKKEYVKRILFVFIDLDNANEEDFKGVKSFLKGKGFKISYTCQSGSGYHILLDVDLDKDKETEVKKFLTYLHTHISTKVDTCTGDLTRLMRVPQSEHNKKDPFILKTLNVNESTEEEIEKNGELIKDFQLEESKETLNTQYLNEIEKEDEFFKEILVEDLNKRQKYISLLDDATGRNPVFIKNLGIAIYKNQIEYKKAAEFLNNWESSRVPALEGWIKKAKEQNLKVNYAELMKWSKDNGIKEFEQLLKEQLKTEVLDEYEVYYLEEEKKETCYLLYYPKKNYYVQKGLSELLTNIFYDLKDKGFDFEKAWDFPNWVDKWDKLSLKAKEGYYYNHIYTKLSTEKRIKLIYNINYAPTEEKFIYIDNKKFFNIYKKTNLLAQDNTEIDEYDFRHIKELVLNLCENNKEYYNWFISWLAHQIQNPSSKLPTAVIFQGEQGTGKGVFKTQVLDSIFGGNCQEINQTHLEASFNEYLLGKQIIVANEVMHNDNRQTLPNILKNLVTDEYITIQRKFRKDLVIRNYTHWIFCTNSDNPIKIEEGDRRYSVFKSKKLRGGGQEAMKFVKALIDNKDHELPHFLAYLKNLDVDYFSVAQPLLTDAKEDIIELNRDSTERFFEFLKSHKDYTKAYLDLFKNDSELGLISTGDGFDYIKSEAIYLFYIEWSKKYGERAVFNKQNFSKKLSKNNINTQLKRNGGKVLRAYPLEILDNFVRCANE